MSRIVFTGPAGLKVHTPEGLAEFNGLGVASVTEDQADYLNDRINKGFLVGVSRADTTIGAMDTEAKDGTAALDEPQGGQGKKAGK